MQTGSPEGKAGIILALGDWVLQSKGQGVVFLVDVDQGSISLTSERTIALSQVGILPE